MNSDIKREWQLVRARAVLAEHRQSTVDGLCCTCQPDPCAIREPGVAILSRYLNAPRRSVPDSQRLSIGRLIARKRRDQGQSQHELAAALCRASGWATVTRHEISRWEHGRRVPTACWRHFLVKVLNISAEDIRECPAPD